VCLFPCCWCSSDDHSLHWLVVVILEHTVTVDECLLWDPSGLAEPEGVCVCVCWLLLLYTMNFLLYSILSSFIYSMYNRYNRYRTNKNKQQNTVSSRVGHLNECDLNQLIFLSKKLSDLNHTYFCIFQFILCCKAKIMKLWLIVAYLLFAQQEHNRK